MHPLLVSHAWGICLDVDSTWCMLSSERTTVIKQTRPNSFVFPNSYVDTERHVTSRNVSVAQSVSAFGC